MLSLGRTTEETVAHLCMPINFAFTIVLVACLDPAVQATGVLSPSCVGWLLSAFLYARYRYPAPKPQDFRPDH